MHRGLTVKALGHRLGFVNPLLYSAAPNSFNEVVGGDNGAYQAGGRWSPVVGLGSPNGANLVTNLVMPSPAVALKGRRVGSGAGQPRPVAPGPKVVDDGQQVA